ncbi:FUSC family protein [Micromonospora sp. NPDC049060]|uniref:FUSC family protein n=1 Tax=Micromonospora sp. NPDC049060 TaxID=3154828 RepID=UPI0033E29F99
MQAGLAAALAWLAARTLLGGEDPTFAPAAAVGVIAAAIGNHARRAVELVAGVGLGILVGDLLIGLLGTGAWQTGTIVFVAVAVAAAVRGTGALMAQAGGTGVLVATVTPTNPDLELPRTLNALIGGAIGLLVVLIIVPLNPLRTLRRVADPALDTFAKHMTASARALADGEARAAEVLLDEMRAAEPELDRLDEVIVAAEEVARHSPLRRHRRRVLEAYSHGTEHMERAFRNSRALVRRIETILRDDEPVPPDLPAAIELYGEAVRMLHREYLAVEEPVGARERVLAAVRAAGEACRQDIGFSGTIVVSQLRTIANDLLRATGVPRDEARRLVRQAAAGHR